MGRRSTDVSSPDMEGCNLRLKIDEMMTQFGEAFLQLAWDFSQSARKGSGIDGNNQSVCLWDVAARGQQSVCDRKIYPGLGTSSGNGAPV